jgi:hypothetical protein
VTPAGALADVARFGPYFAVSPQAGPSWRPLSELPGRALADRVDGTRERLAEIIGGKPVEYRVAASTAHLGIVARLVSPILAVAVRHRLVVRVDPRTVRWEPVLGGPVPLAFGEPEARAATSPHDAAALLEEHLLATTIDPITRATQELSHLAHGLLQGNVVSGFAAAARMIDTAEPALDARAIVEALLTGPLSGSGRYSDAGGFRRRSCCLLYRLAPDAGVCSDCTLTRS